MTDDQMTERAAREMEREARGWDMRLAPDEARDLARALDAAGLLRRPDDPQVNIEITRTGRTCVVKRSGQVIFDGVGHEALIRTESAVARTEGGRR